MCFDKIVCSQHDHPDLPQKSDVQGARTNLYDGISNSFGTTQPNLFLSPTPAGDLSIVSRRERYYLAREDLSNLFVFGKTVNLMSGGLFDSETCIACHPNGNGFVIHLNGLDYIIPRDQLERVVRAEVPGLIVKPTGST
jgi:hypothetical protein